MQLKKLMIECRRKALWLNVSSLITFTLTLYKGYRLIFVDGWDWQNPVAALPRAAVVIVLALATYLTASTAETCEIMADECREELRKQVLTGGLFPRDTRRGAANE